MNVLVLGSGGREHALCWKLSQSNRCDALYCAPGNPGTKALAVNLEMDILDFPAIAKAVIQYEIGLLVVGPELPLTAGIWDFFQEKPELERCKVIGPSKLGAQLEGSKEFAKQFMQKHGIPTASYQTITRENLYQGFRQIDRTSPPYVLKADGLASGKGVLLTDDPDEAKRELATMVSHVDRSAPARKVLLEEFMPGTECSVFILTDGKTYAILPTAMDYKRIGEGNVGPNTGGMGAISPAPVMDAILMERIRETIIAPVLEGLKADHITYKGFLYIGLMVNDGIPRVVEFNVRMGDPETQAVLPLLNCDLLQLFQSVGEGTLSENKVEIHPGYSVAVVLASKGYPNAPMKGQRIRLPNPPSSHALVFHSGTRGEHSMLAVNGGRVFSVSAQDSIRANALRYAYETAHAIQYEGKYLRTDIGCEEK
jgi:phosphoribosylamine--glycine ligase